MQKPLRYASFTILGVSAIGIAALLILAVVLMYKVMTDHVQRLRQQNQHQDQVEVVAECKAAKESVEALRAKGYESAAAAVDVALACDPSLRYKRQAKIVAVVFMVAAAVGGLWMLTLFANTPRL